MKEGVHLHSLVGGCFLLPGEGHEAREKVWEECRARAFSTLHHTSQYVPTSHKPEKQSPRRVKWATARSRFTCAQEKVSDSVS